MGIEATSSTSVSSSSTVQTSAASNSENAKKTSADSSFKDEMKNISTETKKDEDKTVDKSDDKVNSVQNDSNKESENVTSKDKDDANSENFSLSCSVTDAEMSRLNALNSLNNANAMLSNDISQVAKLNEMSSVSKAANVGTVFNFGLSDNSAKNTISMTQSDDQFFINLTQNNEKNISTQNVVAQAQSMLNSGAEAAEVKQNVQVSQTLLNAISQARENNQPLRIDFDQNVSVILRVGKDGAVAAHFIPGDKAVEQYLRNNIDNLKATFSDNDLPYTDLSYSNSSKQQNERRRQNKQQGE